MAASEVLGLLVRVNLAAAAAILIVMAVRKPLRRRFGARIGYGLWLLPLAAGFSALLPARVVEMAMPDKGLPLLLDARVTFEDGIPAQPVLPLPFVLPPPDMMLLFAWITGVVVAVLVMIHLQRRFLSEARRGRIGPAVVGVLRPRIVTPGDFADRFDAEEQTLVLAHERAHLARQDSRLNSLAAAIQCLLWFNPLIHFATHLMRIDQEMACDETVVTRFPDARRTYAGALVKAQLAIRPLPLGCYWPSGTEHPLLERIAMLKNDTFSPGRRLIGGAALVALTAACAATAWAAQPTQTRMVAVASAAPALAPTAIQAPAKLAAAPVQLAVAEPRKPTIVAPAASPAASPPSPYAVNTDAPRAIEGKIVRFAWTNPTSDITIRDADGKDVVVSTDTAGSLISSGGTRQSIRPGMNVSVRGFASLDGTRVYADPSQITSAGTPLFPKAAANPGMPKTLALRVGNCGTMPMALIEQAVAKDPASVDGVVNAWQADCDAKVAKALR